MGAIDFAEQLLEFAEVETLYGSPGASALLHELEQYQGIAPHSAQMLTQADRWQQVFQQMRPAAIAP